MQVNMGNIQENNDYLQSLWKQRVFVFLNKFDYITG